MTSITDRMVKGLKPKAATRIQYDRQIPGFGVRITPNGAVSFVLNYRIHGEEHRYTIGRYPEYSSEKAREEARELRQGIRKGMDPFEERKRRTHEAIEAQARSRTLKDLADAYMERHAIPYKRPRSVREDRSMLDTVILTRLGAFRLQAITRRDLQELHQELKGTPYRANRVLALLSKMFNFALGDTEGVWGVSVNPATRITKFHEEPRSRWLTAKEITALSKALSKADNQQAADAIRLMMLTGARKSEVLDATVEQFNLARAVWTKPSHHTKQKKTEHVPLNPPALALLRRLLRNRKAGEYVFPGRGGDGPLREIKQHWADILNAAGLEDVRMHDLRHTFASHLVSSGVPLQVVGGLLGHTQAHTTQRYAHLSDGALRNATNIFAEIVKMGAGAPRVSAKRRKRTGAA